MSSFTRHLLTLTVSVFLLLQLTNAAYNETDSRDYVYSVAMTHCSVKSILSWTCGQACNHLTGYQPYHAEVITASPGQTFTYAMLFNPSKQRFVIVWRGTLGNYQLLEEILQGGSVPYELTKIPGAEVLAYFYKHYVKDIRPKVIPLLQKAFATFKGYQFVFTGHSLGGALTTLTAFDAVSSGIVPSSQAILYNYGSPRVGNYAFVTAVEAVIPEIYRVTHYKDLIPHVPPCIKDSKGVCQKSKTSNNLPATWYAYHLKTEVFYNQPSTSYIICKDEEDLTCANQYKIASTSMAYHEHYLGVHITCAHSANKFDYKDRFRPVKSAPIHH